MKGNGITVHHDAAKSVAIIAMDYGFNVLSQEFIQSLHEAIIRAFEYARKERAKAIILHGNGRAFSAGASLFEIRSWLLSKENPETAIRKGLGSLHDLMDRVTGLTAPVVTIASGYTLGGGLELFLAGHARLLTSGAKLQFPEYMYGISPGAGGTARLQRLISKGKLNTREYSRFVRGSEIISHTEAVQTGIAEWFFPDAAAAFEWVAERSKEELQAYLFERLLCSPEARETEIDRFCKRIFENKDLFLEKVHLLESKG